MAAPAQRAPFGHAVASICYEHAHATRTMHMITLPCCALQCSLTLARTALRCTASPMGGRRHKGIGMNRAKKAKPVAFNQAASSYLNQGR